MNQAMKLLESIGLGGPKIEPKSKPKKYVRLLWDSMKQGTYVKAKHGPLK